MEQANFYHFRHNSTRVTPSRVVLIGFNKCATRSLTQLFERAGHAVVHNKLRKPWRKSVNAARVLRANLEQGRRSLAGMEDYLFYSDLIDVTDDYYFEGNTVFRAILRDYPDTLFILNTRNREDWIRSRLRHGHGEFAKRCMRALRLTDEAELIAFWRNLWDNHLAEVRLAMAEQPEQLVEFNIDCDNVADLCARLSVFGLSSDHWGDQGRSRGRKMHPALAWAKRVWAHHRPRG